MALGPRLRGDERGTTATMRQRRVTVRVGRKIRRRRVLQRWFAAAVASILFASVGLSSAWAQEGFRSPTGNIHCQFSAVDGDATIRCDLRQVSNRSFPRPRNCDLEFGQAFEISARAARGTPLCYGDTAQDDRLPVLPYGRAGSAQVLPAYRSKAACRAGTPAAMGLRCRGRRRAYFSGIAAAGSLDWAI